MINWNRCEDKMPDTVGDYLICYELFGYQYVDIAYIEDDVFMIPCNDGETCPVEYPTHWTELNKPRPTND